MSTGVITAAFLIAVLAVIVSSALTKQANRRNASKRRHLWDDGSAGNPDGSTGNPDGSTEGGHNGSSCGGSSCGGGGCGGGGN